MLSRLGIRSASKTPCLVRTITTKNTIVDQVTGKTIKLADPNHPEFGDYENPEPLYAQDRDPYAKYDFQQMRRNFGERLRIDDDMYDMWSPDRFNHTPDLTALKHLGIFFGSVIALAYGVYFFELNPEKPAAPRSYPYNGLAKALGSGSPEQDYFYKVKSDPHAEDAGVLSSDSDIEYNRKVYENENADFFKA